MVRLTKPLMSQAARGKLGNAVEFSSWKNRSTATKRRRPRQPRTLEQRATRLWLTWLAKDWASATPEQKATYGPPAIAADVSPYNAFIGYNLTRLQGLPNRYQGIQNGGFFPTRYYDTPQSGSYDATVSVSTTGQVLSFTHRIEVVSHTNGWFLSWHILDNGRLGITYDGTIHIENKLPIGFHDIKIENISAGFHEFVFAGCSYHGQPRLNYFKRNVTVLAS